MVLFSESKYYQLQSCGLNSCVLIVLGESVKEIKLDYGMILFNMFNQLYHRKYINHWLRLKF